MVIVYPDPSLTAEQIERGAREGVTEEGFQLIPLGDARAQNVTGGSGRMVSVRGSMQGTQIQGVMAGYTNGAGSGVTVVAVTTLEAWEQLRPHAEAMATNVRLYAPEVGPRLAQARAALSGHSLVWSHNSHQVSQNSSGYHTGSSVNAFEAWHCCAGGRGRYEGARSSSYQGGGLFGASESGPGAWDGAWSLDARGEDFRLTFRFDDGSTQSWNVSVDANENVYVEGRRVEVRRDSICQ
jgi:hypothetical protein